MKDDTETRSATLTLHCPTEDVEFDVYLTDLKLLRDTVIKPRCGIFCEHPDPIDKPVERLVVSKSYSFSGVTSGAPRKR